MSHQYKEFTTCLPQRWKMIPTKIEDKDAIIKRYRVRSTGKHGATLETSIPREVFEREARRQNMTVQEALRNLIAVWHYDGFHGLFLTFQKPSRHESETQQSPPTLEHEIPNPKSKAMQQANCNDSSTQVNYPRAREKYGKLETVTMEVDGQLVINPILREVKAHVE
jgi:hypothetical protein